MYCYVRNLLSIRHTFQCFFRRVPICALQVTGSKFYSTEITRDREQYPRYIHPAQEHKQRHASRAVRFAVVGHTLDHRYTVDPERMDNVTGLPVAVLHLLDDILGLSVVINGDNSSKEY